jgi:hypothetical protein
MSAAVSKPSMLPSLAEGRRNSFRGRRLHADPDAIHLAGDSRRLASGLPGVIIARNLRRRRLTAFESSPQKAASDLS